MLNDLVIRNFRLFDNLYIPRLGQVNLITGKNNCGKSTVLEALRILAKKAKAPLLQEIASSHDEGSQLVATSISDEEAREFPYQHLFPGRVFPISDDKEIFIGESKGSEAVAIRHLLYENTYEEIKDPETSEVINRRKRVFLAKGNPDALGAEQLLAVYHGENAIQFIELTDDRYAARRSSFADRPVPGERPLSYIPTRFLSSDILALQWDSLLFTEYADHVKTALRIIDPDFEDLGFVKKERFVRRERDESERYALIKRKNSSRGIPLNSMGDGMLRVLQLTLGLFQARGGFLLIDEFENGLHHSVQEEVWSKLFLLAENLNVQIFATAHSDDAVRAFSRASRKTEQQGVLVNLAPSALDQNRGQVVATVYDEGQLDYIIETGIEVRV